MRRLAVVLMCASSWVSSGDRGDL